MERVNHPGSIEILHGNLSNRFLTFLGEIHQKSCDPVVYCRFYYFAVTNR